jgi:glycosyltransferase involved in cell wall biosynthesis
MRHSRLRIEQHDSRNVCAPSVPDERPNSSRLLMKPKRVVHIGNDPDGAGGIAAVIRGHLARPPSAVGLTEASWISYKPGSSRRGHLSTYLQIARRVLVSDDLRKSVVHVHLSRRGSLLREGSLILLARMRRSPRVVVTVHGSTAASGGYLGRLALRFVLLPAHIVHVLSASHRALLRSADSRVVVMPNDVQARGSVVPIEQRERLVVFLGQISNRKGVDILLEAWPPLADMGWHLELCGEMVDDSADLLENLAPGCSYGGYLTPSAVSELLQRATMLVLPSRAEALPMAVCEAMAAGCAVVVTDVGGVAELLDGPREKQLLHSHDPADLSRLLQDLLEDTPSLAQLVDDNRARSADFSSNVLSPRWRTVYLDDAEERPEESRVIDVRTADERARLQRRVLLNRR